MRGHLANVHQCVPAKARLVVATPICILADYHRNIKPNPFIFDKANKDTLPVFLAIIARLRLSSSVVIGEDKHLSPSKQPVKPNVKEGSKINLHTSIMDCLISTGVAIARMKMRHRSVARMMDIASNLVYSEPVVNGLTAQDYRVAHLLTLRIDSLMVDNNFRDPRAGDHLLHFIKTVGVCYRGYQETVGVACR